MTPGQMKTRTKTFVLRILKLVRALPKDAVGRALADQVIRCGASVGANYRASCRARSRKEFIAKLGIVEEEADEACFWLEVIMEDGILKCALVEPLWTEASHILAIVSASRITASRNERLTRSSNRQSAIGNRQSNPTQAPERRQSS